MNKFIHLAYPCDSCNLTAEDNETPHTSCEDCSWVGCSDCMEDHNFFSHGDEHETNLRDETQNG
jgi:hypothetical protein